MQTPVRTPTPSGSIRTVRTECLDWLLIVGRCHLERVLCTYVRYYTPPLAAARASSSRCAYRCLLTSLSSLDQQKTAREKGRSMSALLPSKITTLTVFVRVRLVKML